MAQESSFPDDLLQLGSVDQWSAAECAENLAKMTAFHEGTTTTPRKKRRQ